MPRLLNESDRRSLPKTPYRVINWPECDRGLVRRCNVRAWIDEAVVAG